MNKTKCDFNKLLDIWDRCPDIKDCELPYERCYTCKKPKQPHTLTKEVRYAYDEYKPCDT